MLAYTSLAMIPALVFFLAAETPHRRRPHRGGEGMTAESTTRQNSQVAMTDAPWRDASRPVAERVEALVGAMTLDEKLAQLYGVWVGASDDGGDVAPHQHDLNDDVDLDELLPAGLGQLTRPFGTAPVDAAIGALSLMRTQQRIVAANRFGIPAVAHEECLAGFAAWGATAYPVPLSLGRVVRPGARRADVAAHRRRHAIGRRAPGPRARARRRARRPLGPGRGDHRRGPVPRRRRSEPPTCAGSSRRASSRR